MRAQITIVILGVILSLFFLKSRRKWLRGLQFGIFALLLIQIAGGVIWGATNWTYEMVQRKTKVAGVLNARDAEAKAVLRHIYSDPIKLLFGEGWGATLYLPTAGRVVRFTHNGILFLLWKTGLLGTAAISVYLFKTVVPKGTTVCYKEYFQRHAPLVIGATSAVLIFGLIEMGYKMISFGFMLCMMQAMLLESNMNGKCYEE